MAAKINIAKIRKRLGLSQTQLAKKLGVKQASVSRWETGECVPSGPVRKLLQQIVAEAA